MKKIIVLLIAAMTVSMVSAQQFTQTLFEGKKITGIDVGGSFKITLRQGSDTKATVRIPSKYQDKLYFKLENGVVKVGFNNLNDRDRNATFELDVVCSSLSTVDISGACKVTATGDFDCGRNFEFDASGASNANFSGIIRNISNMSFELSGASNITLGAEISGKLDIDGSGASRVTLRGKAANVDAELSGASIIMMSEMPVKTLSVDGSGSSKMEVYVTDSISADLSGASNVRYKGSPKLSVDTSGGSSVKSM